MAQKRSGDGRPIAGQTGAGRHKPKKHRGSRRAKLIAALKDQDYNGRV